MSGWAAAVQAGLQVADTGLSIWSADRANRQSRAMAREQMHFQERMQRNRYQYTMEDMRKAGLNPILAYSQGGGSAPSGAMATAQSVAPEGAGLSKGWSAYAQRRLTEQAIKNSEMDERVKRETEANLQATRHKTDQERINLNTVEKILGNNVDTSAYEAEVSNQLKKVYEANPWMKYIDALSKSVQGAAGAGNSARSLMGK